MDSNKDGNDIDVINQYLDNAEVAKHAPGMPKATYTTWGRISSLINERDMLRLRVRELEEMVKEYIDILTRTQELLRELVRKE